MAVKAVVIGAGRMGRRHLQVVRELGLEIAGVADPNPEARALASSEQKVPSERCFEDAAGMLETVRPELVVVATTAPTHAEYVRRAVAVGATKILCEKPMATSLADCDAMLSLCRERGVALAVNHQMRFMEQYTVPKAIIDSEAFGGLSSVTVVAGNFGMAMNASHYVEMFRFMAGEPPVEAQAWFSAEKVPNPRGAQFEDRAGTLRLTTASGKRFVLDASADQGHGMHVIYAGRFGQIFVDELTGFLRAETRQPEHRTLPTTRYGMPHTVTTREIAPADAVAPTRAVMAALLEGKNVPDGTVGRMAVAALVAAHVSDERGHVPVKLDDALPRDRVFPWA